MSKKMIIVFGKASNKEVARIIVPKTDGHINLLAFLHKFNIPMASSCLGEGICHKCVFNSEGLACMTKVESLFESNSDTVHITIDYL